VKRERILTGLEIFGKTHDEKGETLDLDSFPALILLFFGGGKGISISLELSPRERKSEERKGSFLIRRL